MKSIMWLGAAMLSAPAVAQPAASPAPAASAPAPADPARLALARTTVDFVWPLGTYERMMKGTMDQMMDTMMQSMFDMRVGDMLPPGTTDKADPQLTKQTMRQLMEKQDPYFGERMRITNRVMMQEMIPLMNRVEPDIREGLARAYAHKFTEAQLRELNGFFATPTGRFYARESMLTMMDPEVMSTLTKFAPEMVRHMPEIMEKVRAATASLPPPPVSHRAPGAH